MTPESRSRDSIVDEAAHWLAMCSDAAASAEERERFVAWLRRSNLHVEEFLRVSALAARLGDRAIWPDDTLVALREAALRDDRHAVITRIVSSRTPTARVRPRMHWSIAAALGALLIGTALIAGLPRLRASQGQSFTTEIGEMRSIVLRDGSVVELNTRSRLRTSFGADIRRITLEEGEAIFRVAKDPARPFHVVAGDTEVVAVGTQFNVYAAPDRTVVTVLEGRVRVSDRTSPPARVELGSGEQAVVAPRQPIRRVTLADPDRVKAWTARRLVFEDETLAGVASQFARYSPRLIRIGDARLAGRRISGVFDANDPASLVQFLGTEDDITIEASDDGWLLH